MDYCDIHGLKWHSISELMTLITLSRSKVDHFSRSDTLQHIPKKPTVGSLQQLENLGMYFCVSVAVLLMKQHPILNRIEHIQGLILK